MPKPTLLENILVATIYLAVVALLVILELWV